MIRAYYSVPHLPVLCCKENCSSVWNSSWVALTCTVLQSANLWDMEVCINTCIFKSLQFEIITFIIIDNTSLASQEPSPIRNCASREYGNVLLFIRWVSVQYPPKAWVFAVFLCYLACGSVTYKCENFSWKTVVQVFYFSFFPNTKAHLIILLLSCQDSGYLAVSC